MSLRPSALPKLTLCACYKSDPNPGPAAGRGTSLDTMFRARIQELPEPEDGFQPTEADNVAVEWAVATARALAGGTPIITNEDDCRVTIPGIENPGTADAILPERLAHADLKTGQKRNYCEQMAAYALGLMEQHFASEWTAHLLFCDQKEVVTHRFTFDEARQIVEAVVRKFHDPDKQPAVNEYCGWCLERESCPARLAEAGKAVAVAEPGFQFELILADNDRLGKFLSACGILDDFREQAEAAAKERIESGQVISGWKIASRRGPEFVGNDDVGRFVAEIGIGPVLAAYGSLSAKKFRELWEQNLPDRPFPEELIKHGKASLTLRAAKSTTAATK